MKELTHNPEWEPNPHGSNELLEYPDFYISYNAHMGDMGIFSSDNGEVETAICTENGEKFYVLNGDFRETYQQLARKGGLKECLEYFRLRKDAVGSSWSTG